MAALRRIAFVFLLSIIGGARAADCPEPACFNTPITLLVGFPPGGQTDILARSFAAKLQVQIGYPVVVENKAGASGNIAAEQLARAPKDGRIILFTTSTVLTVNTALYKLTFDPMKDLAPVALYAAAPQVLVADPSLPAKTVSELVTLAKQKPGTISFASAGNGSLSHLAGEQFKIMAGVQLTHVPYKGGGPAITDLLGGQVQTMIVDLAQAMPLVRAGKLRALAVTSARRSPAAPEIPTLEESGLKGFESEATFGMLLPAGTDPRIISRLNTEVRKALSQADTKDFFEKNGFTALGGSSEDFVRYLRAGSERWARVIKESGTKVD